MTIDKAIRILTPGTTENEVATYLEFDAAEGLGIEALKAVKKSRGYGYRGCEPRLPGETEE